MPGFDPADGGAAARVLLLLETPGPDPRPGRAPRDGAPRIVSRDNATGTARNLARFLGAAGIARADTLLWNAVPWIVHAPGARNRALRRGEIVAGQALLPPFLALLPRLRVVVLAGRVAGEARDLVAETRPHVMVLAMPHPSPTHVCTSPNVPARITSVLTDTARLLDDE
ncbi:uracil-DNA glycosylase [Sphingomonas sp. NBWT7]|uniref:uracil-DNA glycosylase n=1 Tax=Sphingomonas sp. NBWT7 TaxID=2596913 RepID=UPI00215647C9|nr:uracil-DNA glycosylase [Sphingomonas sp. NBWT7]